MWKLLIGFVVSGDSKKLEILDQEMLNYRMLITHDVDRASVDDYYDFKDEILYQLDWKKIKKNIKLTRNKSICRGEGADGRMLRVLEENSGIPHKKYLLCSIFEDFKKLEFSLSEKYPSLNFDSVALDEAFLKDE
jgi:hypothetical protein